MALRFPLLEEIRSLCSSSWGCKGFSVYSHQRLNKDSLEGTPTVEPERWRVFPSITAQRGEHCGLF